MRKRRKREWLNVHISKRPKRKLVHVLRFCSVLLLHPLRYMASIDKYRQMNCAQHPVNTTRECFVYRSCSLLTVLVFLANLHAKIHRVTGFSTTSLSTPLSPCCIAFCFVYDRKLACPLALTFILVEVLQMARPLLKAGAWQCWLNSWVDCLQGVGES